MHTFENSVEKNMTRRRINWNTKWTQYKKIHMLAEKKK
jgi:hypothetical protein